MGIYGLVPFVFERGGGCVCFCEKEVQIVSVGVTARDFWRPGGCRIWNLGHELGDIATFRKAIETALDGLE